ncbi:MAG: 2-hydroxyacid dehydrogenase [Candidatus Excrementavichristensenella sp.]|jgi:D-3-phosphoglycerate dehydrogenase
MKVRIIGDLYIDSEYMRGCFESKKIKNIDIGSVQWVLETHGDLQKVNLLVEHGGSEVYEVPNYVINAIKDAEVIITQFCPVNRRVIDNCPDLKAIGTVRAGLENVNVEYAKEKGIRIFNNAGRNANAVADFTVGMLLAECRNIARAHAAIVSGSWNREFANSGMVPDLPGKTIGIIGFGQIGSKVARRLKAFDAKIICYDPYYCDTNTEFDFVDLNTLLETSDFVTIHMRLTEDTHHMLGKAELAKMKSTAYLINTARSGLIDEAALVEALMKHQIMGAALDVFEEEPLSTKNLLITLDNVTLTPHMAGVTRDAFWGAPDLLVERMREYLES